MLAGRGESSCRCGTAAVDADGDAADDPAIWVAPSPDQSLVIATSDIGSNGEFILSARNTGEARFRASNSTSRRR
jgi:myo-inositol-hexaphosphate 3-phosphohydrolase